MDSTILTLLGFESRSALISSTSWLDRKQLLLLSSWTSEVMGSLVEDTQEDVGGEADAPDKEVDDAVVIVLGTPVDVVEDATVVVAVTTVVVVVGGVDDSLKDTKDM